MLLWEEVPQKTHSETAAEKKSKVHRTSLSIIPKPWWLRVTLPLVLICRIYDSKTKSLTFIFKFFHDIFHHILVERLPSLRQCDIQTVVDFLELLRKKTNKKYFH